MDVIQDLRMHCDILPLHWGLNSSVLSLSAPLWSRASCAVLILSSPEHMEGRDCDMFMLTSQDSKQ
jgi:hypothetical protein